MHELEKFYTDNIKICEYALYHIREIGYRKKQISKKNGGIRELNIPPTTAKTVQKKINEILQSSYKVPNPVHAFIRSDEDKLKNIISNALQHTKKNIVINIDIANFFDSINFGRIRGLFLSKPFEINTKIATKLAQLVTTDNKLPQGAPSSPILSNIICLKLDHNLIKLAKKYSCTYTRYADDITFSTHKKYMDNEILTILMEIKNIIDTNGFQINISKTRAQTSNQTQIVTGLKVNQKVNVSRKYVRQIRSMLFSWWRDGLDNASKKHFSFYNTQPKKYKTDKQRSFQNILIGKINFLGQVKGYDNHIHIKFLYTYCLLKEKSSISKKLNAFEQLEISNLNEEKLSAIFSQIYDYILVLTEGETDIIYIKSALKYFQEQSKFKNLNLRFCDLKGWFNVKKIHQLLTSNRHNFDEYLLRKKIAPHINKKLKFSSVLDADDPGIRGYFEDNKNKNYFLIDKINQGYIEKLIDKEIIINLINEHGYIIDPKKAKEGKKGKKGTKEKLENHLIEDKTKNEIFSIDNYIVYKEKLIKKTLLAKSISEMENVKYDNFEELLKYLEKLT